MAKDKRKEVVHECRYVGPDAAQQPLRQLAAAPQSPTPEAAKEIALHILSGSRGSYLSRRHYDERAEERDFDIFDIEYAIRNGTCIRGGVYSAEHRNHEYTFRANIDGIDFDAAFALCAKHDLIESPLLLLISGVWKTKTGKKKTTF